MENHREHYRIHYSNSDHPTLEAGGRAHSIVDLSESGACLAKSHVFQENCPMLPVKVTFADGTVISTNAVFLREEPDRVAIRFSPTIPFPIIFAEQRRLKHLAQLKERLNEDEEQRS